MKILPRLKAPIRAGLRAADLAKVGVSAVWSHGLYDGRRLRAWRVEHGEVPVVLIVPRMSDREGALIHPGVQILQTILRGRGVPCEVFNYGLPVAHPTDPWAHVMAVIRELGVKVLGVSLYSQAIEATMRGLRRLKAAYPGVFVVLGGPHPTEAHLSLVGCRFIDFVVRGEAEQSFPELVDRLLRGESATVDVPGVYWYDWSRREVRGRSAPFVDLEPLDARQALRYHLSAGEIRQYRSYGGAHGLVDPRYWPIALVRGCPYACTYCAAYQMSGKRLRFRHAEAVADDVRYYVERYGQRHFSFVDDSFTEHYEYVVEFCQALLARDLRIFWTTDNGIRYESLGGGKRLTQYLAGGSVRNIDDLLRLMIRAGWRGTSIGLESGSLRVRDELVRKGGMRITNEAIRQNLLRLKSIAREEGVYFYVNAYVMLGFPELVLRNGQIIAAETDSEREETRALVMRLQGAGAIDFVHPSVVIPLPATEMWDHLTVREKIQILTSRVPTDHPYRGRIDEVARMVVREAEERGRADASCGPGARPIAATGHAGTRYLVDAEARFWSVMYELPDDAQLAVHAAYDYFNADASYKIAMKRDDGQRLWALRQRIMDDFYGELRVEYRLLRHVFARCSSLWEVVSYLACLSRIYLPETKTRYSS